jgi:ribosomal protein S18 acetylase RimI-like enzyme
MSVSFGVEFEFDYIDSENHRAVFCGSTPNYVAQNWSYQNDPTASSELRTPVFTSLEQFIAECNSQFEAMLRARERLIPYMCNGERRSLGQHMHIGKPRLRLTIETRKRLAKVLAPFYPFMASLHAQPIPSERGLSTSYSRSLIYYNDVISTDHYADISASHLGTLELRLFDSNIPQASLTCAWLSTELAKKAFRNRSLANNENMDFRAYDSERAKGLRYGLVGLDVTSYLRRLKGVLGNVEIPNIASLREALYLMARYRLNFYGAWKYSNVKPYDYMKAQLRDCSKFLENILSIDNAQHRDKISQWIIEANQIENLDQLIGLSIGVDRSLTLALSEAIEQRAEAQPNMVRALAQTTVRSLGRSQIRECLEHGNFRIARINDFGTLSSNDVAQQISQLLTHHGEGLANPMTPEDIIHTDFRFYVFVAYDRVSGLEQICGAIAVHVSSGEIRSLVVDRRFRRLGIARALLAHVLEVLRERNLLRAYAWVRTENVASANLFANLGFTVQQLNGRSAMFEKQLRSV